MNMNPLWGQVLLIAFISITAIQLFYYLFFYIRLAFYKAEAKTVSQTHPVSVIICARDEAGNLTRNLPGALVQEYRTTHEVIVVNDNSFDESRYLLEEFQKMYKQLQVVELKQEAQLIPGKKYPLGVGIRTAKHEVVLLTDADCIPASEHWIEKMQEIYGPDTEIVLGYGAYHKKKGFFNKLVRWETFHTALQYLTYAIARLPYMGVGRNLSYKRTVFFRHKGFTSHHHIPSGDDDLFVNMAATAKNTKISLDKDSFTLSEPAANWRQWIRQKNRHYSTGKYYKGIHQFLLGMYALSHFLFYPLLVACSIFCTWPWVLGIFGVRFAIQAIVFYFAMRRLDELDLYPWFLVLDIWMFFYYFIFSAALIKKAKPLWK